jgi:hypothetical protein
MPVILSYGLASAEKKPVAWFRPVIALQFSCLELYSEPTPIPTSQYRSSDAAISLSLSRTEVNANLSWYVYR